jgi:predicted Zn-dependent protease
VSAERPASLIRTLRGLVAMGVLCAVITGCALPSSAGPATRDAGRAPAPSQAGEPSTRALNQQEAQRLQRLMAPLVRAMDHPRPLDQVKIGITDDSHINAASGGGGTFYVTTGLLQKATDRQLVGVLAHELAHDDLGHVAKAQVLGVGLSIGMVILDQFFPGSRALTPIAGNLVAGAYSRNEEYAADRHGVDILKRAGYPASTMIDTLTWLMQIEGADSGGFFATHPATADRIQALRDRQ